MTYRLIERRHARPRHDWTLTAIYLVVIAALILGAIMAHSHVSGGL